MGIYHERWPGCTNENTTPLKVWFTVLFVTIAALNFGSLCTLFAKINALMGENGTSIK